MLMDSIPPATIISASPALMAWAAIMTDFRPEAHTLFMVVAGTSLGIPDRMSTCRAGFCPWPAVRTLPKITSSTCSGLRFALLSAS